MNILLFTLLFLTFQGTARGTTCAECGSGKQPEWLNLAVNKCRIETSVNHCDQFLKEFPELKNKEIRSCLPQEVCSEQTGENRNLIGACTAGIIDVLVKAFTARQIKIEKCAVTPGCKESLIEILLQTPKYQNVSTEKLKSFPLNFLYSELDDQKYILSTIARQNSRSHFLSNQVCSGPQCQRAAVEQTDMLGLASKFYHSLVKQTTDQIGKEVGYYHCLTQEAKAELWCARARNLAVSLGGMKLAQMINVTERGEKLAGLVEKRGSSASIELGAKRTAFLKNYENIQFNKPGDNARFMELYNSPAQPNRRFFVVENAEMKSLNDSLKDTSFVDALNGKYKSMMMQKIEALKAQYPDLKVLVYDDAKSLQFAFEGKLPPNLQTKLGVLFEDTNKEYKEFLRSENILRTSDRSDFYFRAGYGQTGSEMNYAARYARRDSSTNEIRSFDDARVRSAANSGTQEVQSTSRQLQRDFQGTQVIAKDGSLSQNAWDILRKNKDISQVQSEFKREFGLSISDEQAEKLMAFKNRTDEFSPAVLTEEKSNLSLANSAAGGAAIDRAGLGAINLQAVQQGLMNATDATSGVSQVADRVNSITSNMKVSEYQTNYLTNRVAKSADNSYAVSRSGDNFKVVPQKPMSATEKQEFVNKIQSQSTQNQSHQNRVVFVADGIKNRSVPDVLVGHGNEIEKSIRKNLAGVDKTELNRTTFAIDMQTTEVGKGKVKLIMNNASRFSEAEKYEIQKSYEKAVEKFNKENGTHYEIEKFVKANQGSDLQSLAWQANDKGQRELANKIEKDIAHKLADEPIVHSVELRASGEYPHNSQPMLVYLKDGTRAILKGTIKNNPLSEVAAYEVDKKLGMGQVPVTIYKNIDGKPSSLQLFIEDTSNSKLISFPPSSRFFDLLIGNYDRHSTNYLVKNGRQINIDHGVAFGNPDKTIDKIDWHGVFSEYKDHIEEVAEKIKSSKTPSEKNKLLLELKSVLPTREQYERLVTTPTSEWRNTLNPYLNEQQIKLFFERRSALIDLIENTRRAAGDNIFLDGITSPLLQRRFHPHEPE